MRKEQTNLILKIINKYIDKLIYNMNLIKINLLWLSELFEIASKSHIILSLFFIFYLIILFKNNKN